jgi:hypothetical protein
MKRTLHILTRPEDETARAILNECRHDGQHPATAPNDAPPHETVVVDLTLPNPDYKQLARAVFEADAVAVW